MKIIIEVIFFLPVVHDVQIKNKRLHVHPVFMVVTSYNKFCYFFEVVLLMFKQVLGQINHVIMILSYFPASAPLFRLRIGVAHIS